MPETKTPAQIAKAGKRNPRLIWLLVVGLAAMAIWTFAIESADASTAAEYFDLAGNSLMPMLFAVVAAIILVRRPGNRIGWLLMVVPAQLVVQVLLDALFLQQVVEAQTLTTGQFLFAWFSAFSWWFLITPILLIFLIYPTGNLISPKWRRVVYLLLFTIASDVAVYSFAPTLTIGEAAIPIPNPLSILSAEIFAAGEVVFGILLLLSVMLSTTSVFFRYRQAKDLERAQLRWLFFAGLFFFATFITNLAFSVSGIESPILNGLFTLGFISIPIAIGIGVLRYRLWDIDVVINRSLVYGLLTTVLAAIFAAIAGIGGQAAKAATGEDLGAAAAAVGALVVASLFQPLRAAIEKGINRRLFPENIDLTEGLGELNPDLWPFLSTKEILNASLEHLQDIYKFDKAAAFVANGKGFKPAAAVGISAAKAKYAPSSNETTLFLQKKAVKTERASDFVLTVPIYWSRRKAPRILGALRLGKRPEGRGYSSQEIRALESFGGKLGQPIYALGSKKR